MPAANQMDDHDILIELRTNFNAFSTQYKIDMTELKNGTATKLANHELRLDKIEDVIKETNLLKSYKEFIALKGQIRDFTVGAKTARWLVGGVSGILGGVITLFLIPILKAVGILK